MILQRLLPTQHHEAAKLIHRALDTWYRARLNCDKFGSTWEPFTIIPEVYAALDPQCGVTAVDADGSLLGCAFYHPRETHVGVGIVATSPTASGRGIARAMVEEIQRSTAGRPLRLVSSAMNLDSFSLYTRLGFVPEEMFQDVVLEVPSTGLNHPHHAKVRQATVEDIPNMVALEMELRGLKRPEDYRYFLGNSEGWNSLVYVNDDGQFQGFLHASTHPACRMLGPGVAISEAVMSELIAAQLDRVFRGHSVLWLVPVKATGLVRQAYAWGARNTEIHLSSSCGAKVPFPQSGVILPTFLPESG
jgi:GNAT superfamily N-acetyltransferase